MTRTTTHNTTQKETKVNTGYVHRLSLVIASALLAVLAFGVATADAARVANPGPVQFRFESGTLQIKSNSFDTGSESQPAVATGTINANGNVTINSFTFPPFEPIDGPLGTVNISVTVLSASGSVNPLTGAASFSASLRIDADGGGVGGDCKISPININMSTSNAGGVPYNTNNGMVTVADHTFSVPGASGCTTFPVNVNSIINDELGLPSSSGNNHGVLTARSVPVLQKAIVPSFTASPSSGPAPLNVTFDASSTFHTRPISTYQWDFDGNGTFDQTTTGPTVSTTYNTEGTRTVRLRVTDADGDSQETTRQVFVEPPRPDLAITKSHTGSFVTGQADSYDIEVTNTGSLEATDTVTVTDTLPPGFNLTGSSGAGWTCDPQDGQTVTCTTDEDVAIGGSLPTLTLEVVPDTAGAFVNTASVSVLGDLNPSNDTAEDPTNVIQSGIDLTVSKSLDPDDGDLIRGRRATYLVSVANEGTLPATERIRVVDTLPDGLSFVGAAGGPWTCSYVAPEVRCFTDDDLDAGHSLEDLRIRVEVATDAPDEVLNEAAVSVDGESDASDNATVHGGPVSGYAADLELSKSHSGDFVIGAPGFYSLRVKNVGTATAGNDVSVLDVLPDGLTYDSATGDGWACSAAGQDVTCEHAGGIEPGDSLPTLTIRVNVDGSAAPGVTNTAAVYSADDFNVENDVASDPTAIRAPASDLTITKSHQGNFKSDAQGQYEIEVENRSEEPAPGPTTVTDTLPAGLTYVGASGTGWSCSAAGQVVTCTYAGEIAGNASAPVLTITVKTAPSTANSTVVNKASVANGSDGNDANNDAEDPTRIDDRVQPTELFADAWLLTLPPGFKGSLLNGPSARLTSNGNPVEGRTIEFWAPPGLLRPQPRLFCTAVTNANGVAKCQYPPLDLILSLTKYSVKFEGDADYKPSEAQGPIARALGIVL